MNAPPSVIQRSLRDAEDSVALEQARLANKDAGLEAVWHRIQRATSHAAYMPLHEAYAEILASKKAIEEKLVALEAHIKELRKIVDRDDFDFLVEAEAVLSANVGRKRKDDETAAMVAAASLPPQIAARLSGSRQFLAGECPRTTDLAPGMWVACEIQTMRTLAEPWFYASYVLAVHSDDLFVLYGEDGSVRRVSRHFIRLLPSDW